MHCIESHHACTRTGIVPVFSLHSLHQPATLPCQVPAMKERCIPWHSWLSVWYPPRYSVYCQAKMPGCCGPEYRYCAGYHGWWRGIHCGTRWATGPRGSVSTYLLQVGWWMRHVALSVSSWNLLKDTSGTMVTTGQPHPMADWQAHIHRVQAVVTVDSDSVSWVVL